MSRLNRQNRPVIIIATLLLLGALKVMRPVTMPLIFSLFLVLLAWPLQMRLARHIPGWLATGITFFIFIGILAFFVAALVLSINLIVSKAPDYINEIELSMNAVNRWAESNGFTMFPDNYFGSQSIDEIIGFIGKGVGEIYSLLTFLGLVSLFLLFGLAEVNAFRKKLALNFAHDTSSSIIDSFDKIAAHFQRYLITKTAISALTGILVGLYTWLLGLDFAFIWGLMAFLLNYIPSLGSVISVILISLFGFVQFQSHITILMLFAGIATLQLILGNWVDPRMQGKYLSLSPFVVLFSVIFWSWLWGIPGALLGVPLSIGLVNALQQFERTRPVSNLFAAVPREEN